MKLKDLQLKFKKNNYGFVTERIIDGKTFLFLRGSDPKDEIMVERGTDKIKKIKIKEEKWR